MIKILSSILLALLLTACGSDDKAETKPTKIEKHTDKTTPAELEKMAKSTTTTPSVEKQKQEKSTTAKESTKKSTPTTQEELGKDIFQLTTLDGQTLHVDEAKDGIIFQEHKGKVVFLLFFGYRCPPCLGEIPVLKALSAEKHKDLAIIAMEVQRLPVDQLKLFKKDKGINYTILSENEGQNSQFISYIAQRAQWGGSIPFLVAINPHGEVKVVHVGGLGPNEFKTIYEKLSKEK